MGLHQRGSGRLKVPAEDAERMLRSLERAGFLERRDSAFPAGADEWNTTVSDESRNRAVRLVADLVHDPELALSVIAGVYPVPRSTHMR